MPPTDLLSCDWGTTSFRLRWVSGEERRIVREIREKAGIRAMLDLATVPDAITPKRADFFARFLAAKLQSLLGDEPPPRPVPLVISGMASSSIGWKELPYAKVPFAIDASNLVSQELDWNAPEWVGPTHLISGITTEHDMMRGEESEIIGLMSAPELARYGENCLLVLPGTHSKHVRIENGNVVDWRTFMTGELFEVIGQHSLLRASVDLRPPGASSWAETHPSAFVEGVRAAQELGLSSGLFRVRTRTVLHGVAPDENTAFFSGLLIGAELIELPARAKGAPVLLAGAGTLGKSYACAMETLADRSTRWLQAPPGQVERATIAAHAAFIATHQRVKQPATPVDKRESDRGR